ncbi:LysR family transcriptional regulator [Vitreimonas sp.]|uniref:LysR family transcriptional regulator n=1 Tax=Vitreimonas sp. TaxID=3069702 RepID=UPI002EDB81FC
MKLHHIRNVVAVVERGSLRSAAKHLGLAQPAMSRSIRELEDELGVVLFERNKFGMTLTPVGEIFLRRAKGMQADLQRALDEIEQFKGKDFGKITVAFSAASLGTMLPKLIAPFRQRFPNVRVKVLESALPVMEPDLRDGVVDVFYGPVPEDYSDPALIIERLWDNPRIIVGRRGHPLRGATSLEQLADAGWVAAHMTMDIDTEVVAVFEAAGLPPPRVVMEAGSSLSFTTIIKSSDLLAPMSALLLELMDEEEVLEAFPIRGLPNAAPICAVRRGNMPLTPAAEYWNDLVVRVAGHRVHQLQQAGAA